MAVEAQYPTTTNPVYQDYSFQQDQPRFIDHSLSPPMFFNNGRASINPRKRGRQVTTTNTNAMAMQPPLQLVDFSHLNNQLHQNVVVSTGLGLSFGDQQHCCAQEDFVVVEIKRQRDEIHQILIAQAEQLRRTLAEKRQRHYGALLGAAGESITRRLREKEAQVEKARRRNTELEARAAQLRVESQVWRAKARSQEATATSLQYAIMSLGAAQDSSKRGEEGQAEDAESAYIDPDRVSVSGPACKACQKRTAAVVLLPCRHVCLCTECDRVAHACPLCFTIRNSSVEVFLS